MYDNVFVYDTANTQIYDDLHYSDTRCIYYCSEIYYFVINVSIDWDI